MAADLRSAVGELRALAAADPALLGGAARRARGARPSGPRALVGAAELDGAPAPATPPAGVLLADPLAIRARRFRAVFVCGLQDGEFPRRPVPEPFLSDDDRRGLARAAGLRLPLHEDVLDRERSLFYAAVSRPEDVLFLSWRSSDEEGDPLAPSAFLDDVRALFTDELWEQRGTRLLADVTWAPRDAPTPHELRRAYAAARGAPEPAPLARAGDRRRCSGCSPRAGPSPRAAWRRSPPAACAGWWSSCCARTRTEPDPEPMRRGSLAHAVLERTLALLQERTGSARIAPERLDAALAALRDALARACARCRPAAARTRAVLRGARGRPRALPAHGGGVRRRLRAGASSSGRSAGPTTRTARSPLGDGRRPGDRARRPRRRRRRAAPRSCATTRAARSSAARKWADERQLQVALYLLAVRELLGLEPVAGLYQPLAGRKLVGARARPRRRPRPLHPHRPGRRRRVRRRARGRARAGGAHRGRPARGPPAPVSRSAARAAAAATRGSAAPAEPTGGGAAHEARHARAARRDRRPRASRRSWRPAPARARRR